MPHRHHLESLFQAIDQGYCLCEMIYDDQGCAVDYRFLETNRLFEEMTGLKDANGRTACELVPGLEQHWVDTYAAVAAGQAQRFQNGSEAMGRWFDVFATPVAPQGRFALVFRDTTAQHKAEAEREAARQQAEALLVELNHRVMNSLAMISSILRMETRQAGADHAAAMPLTRVAARLDAVTALYRALHRAETRESVPLRPYLGEVIAGVTASVGDAARIAVSDDIADISLPPGLAAPLGMLVNELMTSALKYAFPDGRQGALSITLAAQGDDALCLTVADNGIGATAAADAPREGTGTGSVLIAAFVDQIAGRLERASTADGMTVSVEFPRPAPTTAG